MRVSIPITQDTQVPDADPRNMRTGRDMVVFVLVRPIDNAMVIRMAFDDSSAENGRRVLELKLADLDDAIRAVRRGR